MRLNQKGLSLIEASMVLALSAVVVAGVMYYYQSASDANKQEQATTELMSLVGGIQSLYSGQPNFEGLTTATMASSNAIPSSLRDEKNGTIKTPYGSLITITPTKSVADNDSFKVAFDVPKNLCVPLSTISFGSGFRGVSIGATTSSTPLTPAKAADACKKAFEGGKETVSKVPLSYTLTN